MWLWRNVSTVMRMGWVGPKPRLPVIPSPRDEGHGAVRMQHAGTIKTATASTSRRSSAATPVAMTTAWETTRWLKRALW
jgi:hypothetical protein